MPKPSAKPEWASGGSAEITAPPSANQQQGWTNSKPPHQWFNWLQNLYWQWINYFETTTDANAAAIAQEISDRGTAVSGEATARSNADTAILNRLALCYDAIVGSDANCTDANLAAAVTRVSAGARILMTTSEALNATVVLDKANLELILKPGVAITKGTATTGLQISASGVRIQGGRVAGFNGGSDKAISVIAGGSYAMLRDIRFASNTTDIDDALDLASSLGCFNE